MSLKNFATLYLGTTKRILGTMLGVTSAAGRQKIMNLYHWYNNPGFDPNALPKDPYKLPKTDIFELTNAENHLTYSGVYQCGFGHLNEIELKTICHLVKHINPSKVFEIGTFEGRTTLNIALNTNPQAQIYSLDLDVSMVHQTKFALEPDEIKYVRPNSGKRFKEQAVATKITHLSGDSATFDFTPYHNQIDVVLVDGAHAYDYVANDTEAALAMVKNGGYIIWGSYTGWEGVRKNLNQYFEQKGVFADLKHIGGTGLAILKVHK
jgi:predicted O-methyltransferase YrrM